MFAEPLFRLISVVIIPSEVQARNLFIGVPLARNHYESIFL